MNKKTILIIAFLALILLIVFPPISAWNITVDNIGPSSIVWNVSEKPDLIIYVSYDGINISNYDPGASLLVQSDLGSNTYHNIKVIAGNETATLSIVTNMSAKEKVNTAIDTWFLVGAVLIFFFCGFAIHWFLFWIGSFVSLYGLADYILKHGSIETSIWNLPFLIYGALFVLGFVLWTFRRKRR